MASRLFDSRPGGPQRARSGRLGFRSATVGAAVLVIAAAFSVGAATSAGAATTPATASISPGTGQADVATDYVLAFTASTALSNGAIRTAIPAGWTLPQTTNSAGAGYVHGAPGTCTSVNTGPTVSPLAGGATQVTLTGVTCAKGEVAKLKYFAADPLKAGLSTFGPTSVQTSSAASFVAITSPSANETAGPTTQFAVSSPSLATTAGAKYSFTVTPEDAGGDVSVYSGTISISSSDTGSSTVLPAPTAAAGAHTFSATLTTAGVQSITATDVKAKKTLTGTLSGITVSPAATALLTWSAVSPTQTNSPGEFPVGSPLSFTLRAMDKYRNATPAYAGKVAFSSSTDRAAVLPAAYTFTPATDRGSHTFLLTPKTVGSETYTATDSHTSTITGKIVVPVSLAVGPATTADLEGTVAVPFSQTFTASGATGAVTWTSTNLPSWLSLNRTSGVVTGTPTAGGIFGPFTITATDSAAPAHSGSWSYSVVVSQASQTVAFTSTAPLAAVYSGPTYTPTGTSTSGLPVTFSADPSTSAVCTGVGVISFVGVGTCTVDANQGGGGGYSAAPQVQQSFPVSGAAQTINFTTTAPGDAEVNGPTYAPAASTDAPTLTVTLGVDASSSAVCSMGTHGTVSFTAIGTCTIDATQGGNADWLAATEVQQSFTVSGAPQTISFTSSAPATAVVGGATYVAAAAASPSGLPVTLTVDNLATSVCAIDGSGNVSFSAVGVCVIDANQGGDSTTWAAAPQVQQSFNVGQGTQTISFTGAAPSNAEVNGPTYAPAASTTAPGLTVALSVDASSSAVCSMDANGTVSFTAAGTCTIDANQAGDADWLAATQVQQNIAVGDTPYLPPGTPITLTRNPGTTADLAPSETLTLNSLTTAFTFDASAFVDPAGGSVADGTLSFHWVIIYSNDAAPFTDAGITGYDSPVLQISKQALEQTLGTSTTTVLQLIVQSGINPAGTTDVSFQIQVTNAALSLNEYNTCQSPLTESQCTNPAALPFQYPQSISFTSDAPSDAVVDGAPYTPQATSSSADDPSAQPVILTVDPSSGAVCTMATDGSVSFTGIGTCTIDANEASSPDFLAAAQVQQSFTVSGEPQSIEFTTTSPNGAVVGGSTYAPGATATSGEAVSLTIDSLAASVCAIDANGNVSFTGVGVCIIDANQPGDDTTWAAAPEAKQSFSVGQGTPAITFTTNAPSNAMVGGSTYTPAATSSSASDSTAPPVALSVDSSSSAVCTMAPNGTVSFTGAGTCTIDANQAASTNWSVAPQVQQSFTVAPALSPQTVTFTSSVPTNALVGQSNYTPTASTTAIGLSAALSVDPTSSSVCSMAADDVVSFTSAGTCTIDANQPGDATYAPAAEAQQSVTVGWPSIEGCLDAGCTDLDQTVTIPPNPASLQCAQQSAAGGGCIANEVDGTINSGSDYYFDGSSAVADPNPDPSQDIVSYDWQIFYPTGQLANKPYSSAGITGYHSAVLHIAQDSLPQLSGDPQVGSDVYWGVELTVTVNGAANTVWFQFVYNSDDSLDLAEGCQSATESYMGNPCSTIAPQLLPVSQTLSFTSSAPSDAVVGGATYTPTAISTAGLPVTLTVDPSSNSVCSMASDGSVSFTGLGTCTIDANQGGDSPYPAAPQVQQSFSVGAPFPQVTATTVEDSNPADNIVQTAVIPPNPGINDCPMQQFPDGGCQINDLDGTVENDFTASLPNMPGATVSYQWHIQYPPIFGIPGVNYYAAGITGFNSPELHIAAGSLPQLAGDRKAGGDPYWRVDLTTTVNGVSTDVWFRFIYDSNFPLDFATNCQLVGEFMGLNCFVVAAQLLPNVAFTTAPPADAVVGGPTYTPIAAVNNVTVNYNLTIDAAAASVCTIASNGSVSFIGVGTCTVDADPISFPASDPPEAQQSFQVGAPYPQVTADTIEDSNPADEEVQSVVVPPNPGINDCPAQQFPDGGCTIADLDGTVDNTFSASLPTAPGTNVTYKWQIYYPPIFGASVPFQDAGITGSDSPVLHIATGSMPELASDSRTSGDPYWRAELTTTVNGTSTSVYFRFIYDSSFSLDFSTDCLLSSVFDGFDCAVVAPQLLPTIAFTTTAPTDAVVGGPTYTPAATVNGLATGVTFTIDATAASVCTISSGGAVSFTGPGTCTLDLNQTARPTNLPAEEQQSFRVGSG